MVALNERVDRRALEASQRIEARALSHPLLTALLVLTLSTTEVASAQAPQPSAQVAHPSMQSGSASMEADKDAATDDEKLEEHSAPSSTEEGQTELVDSFTALDRAQWLRDTRRKAFADTKVDLQLRSYYLDRDRFDDSESEALALGGWAGFKTGYFRERFAFGATGYTSQKVLGDDNKDGTLLLKPGQEGYTVLGELCGEALLWDGARVSAGRRVLDTPYINRNDSRMTPNTFETAVLQGLTGGSDGHPEWRYGFGYVDKIKERNSDEFISMSVVAGAPTNVERGVYAGGANFKQGEFSLGAIDYYSNDIINIFYTETNYAIPLGDKARLQLAAQYTNQRSTGDDLLTGSDFSANQWGVKAEVAYGGALFTTAHTRTGNSASMRSPWSGYPGYTSVQVEDFNRTGEDAWMLRAAYAFQTVPGLSVYGLWVHGSDPKVSTEDRNQEYDLNLQWNVPKGVLEGLMLRLRYAKVDQQAPGNPELTDLRIMIYYEPPGF
jgi:hypothetical protein